MLQRRAFTQIAVVQLLLVGINAAPASWGSSTNTSTSDNQIAIAEQSLSSTSYPPADWEAIWSNFVTENIADSCTGRGGFYSEQLRLTISLYTCLEKEPSGGLVKFFASTGLNITYKRLEALNALNGTGRTLSRTSTMESSATADDATTSATYAPQFLGSAGLDALLHRVADHADDLCLNVDALMNCLDPFLYTCFSDEPTPSDEDAYPKTKRPWDHQRLSDVSSFVNMFSSNLSDSSNQSSEISPSTERSADADRDYSTSEPDTTNDEDTSSSAESRLGSQSYSTSSMEEPTDSTIDAPAETNIIEEIDVVLVIPDNSTESSYSTTADGDVTEDSVHETDPVPHGWFSLPYLTNAERISRLLHRQFQILCDSNMDTRSTEKRPLQDALNALYCVFDGHHTPSSPCPVDDYNSPDSRIIDKANVNCILDTVHDQCSANGADTLHAVIDEYVDEATAVQHGMSTTTEEASTATQETTDEAPASSERMPSAISNRTNPSDTSMWWLVA